MHFISFLLTYFHPGEWANVGGMWRCNVTYKEIGRANAEPMNMPVGMMSWVSPRYRVLDGRAEWCHLANTFE